MCSAPKGNWYNTRGITLVKPFLLPELEVRGLTHHSPAVSCKGRGEADSPLLLLRGAGGEVNRTVLANAPLR